MHDEWIKNWIMQCLAMNCRPSHGLCSLLWLWDPWKSILSSSMGCIASACCQRQGVWRMWCWCILQQLVNICGCVMYFVIVACFVSLLHSELACCVLYDKLCSYVCLVTDNILPKTEVMSVSTILPRHYFIELLPTRVILGVSYLGLYK